MPSRKSLPPEQLGLHFEVAGLLAGVDEAGRGGRGGGGGGGAGHPGAPKPPNRPAPAPKPKGAPAAVILDDLNPIKGLNDSKKLSAATRERLFDEIRARALCCSIAEASVEEIDELNILHATMLAMRRAVEGLRLKPAKVLVDGNRLPVLKMAAEAIVQGDAKVQAISAASILAKVHRDRLCLALHERHPEYGFDGHKGYPTPDHLAALRAHGACAHHRRSFAPVRQALAAAPARDILVAA